jgi:DNA-binding MarR family transcriptional regulator
MTAPLIFPSVLRELARTEQTFLAYAASHVHTLDLTLPQFDILLALGDTEGMNFKQLGEETIITKGTLTGIINRLEDKGLVQRLPSKTDGRSQLVKLTEAGMALYAKAYPEHLTFINRIFDNYAAGEVKALEEALIRLRKAVTLARFGDAGDKSDT